MTAAWRNHSLGGLCELINGRPFRPEEWGNTGLPIVRIQNLNDSRKPFNYFDGAYSEKHLIDSGDVLLSWSGTPGTSFGCFVWDRGQALLNQHIFKVQVCKDLILPEFFVHAVNSRLDEMIGLAHGAAGLRHITKSKLEQIEMPLPSTTEQGRIVSRINECFARVGEVEVLRAKSDKEGKLLLRSFYRDVYSTLRDQFRTIPLRDVGQVVGGGTPSKQNRAFWEGNIPWVSPKDMKRRELDSATDRISESALNESSAKLINKPSVLFVVRGMILAHTLPVSVNTVPLAINQDMKAITPSDAFDVEFVAAMLRGAETYLLRDVEVAGHGTRRLQTEYWQALPIPALSKPEQLRIVSKVKEFEASVDSLRYSCPAVEVRMLRDAILRKAFTGEL